MAKATDWVSYGIPSLDYMLHLATTWVAHSNSMHASRKLCLE